MVNTDDIPAVVEKLSGAGFREALIREEFFNQPSEVFSQPSGAAPHG
jgi:hypothetical protein